MTDKLNAVALDRGAELRKIIEDAVLNVAARSPGNRGPYIFDEATIQALAAEINSRRAPPPLSGKEGEVVERLRERRMISLDIDQPSVSGPDPLCEAAAALITALVAERDGRPALSDQVKRQIAATTRAEAAEAEAARLRKALVKLAAEVAGLAAFEAQVRAIIGNTNWAVLQQRLDAARTALET